MIGFVVSGLDGCLLLIAFRLVYLLCLIWFVNCWVDWYSLVR